MEKKTNRRHPEAAGDEQVREVVREFKDIRQEYVFDADILNGEDDKVRKTKWIIDNKLNQVDRTLLILYADCQSLRKLGQRLGISHTLLAGEIRRIKAHVLEEYDKIKDTEI